MCILKANSTKTTETSEHWKCSTHFAYHCKQWSNPKPMVRVRDEVTSVWHSTQFSLPKAELAPQLPLWRAQSWKGHFMLLGVTCWPSPSHMLLLFQLACSVTAILYLKRKRVWPDARVAERCPDYPHAPKDETQWGHRKDTGVRELKEGSKDGF